MSLRITSQSCVRPNPKFHTPDVVTQASDVKPEKTIVLSASGFVALTSWFLGKAEINMYAISAASGNAISHESQPKTKTTTGMNR
jgi:predicted benzoate:H+ symporter BenE